MSLQVTEAYSSKLGKLSESCNCVYAIVVVFEFYIEFLCNFSHVWTMAKKESILITATLTAAIKKIRKSVSCQLLTIELKSTLSETVSPYYCQIFTLNPFAINKNISYNDPISSLAVESDS